MRTDKPFFGLFFPPATEASSPSPSPGPGEDALTAAAAAAAAVGEEFDVRNEECLVVKEEDNEGNSALPGACPGIDPGPGPGPRLLLSLVDKGPTETGSSKA